MSATDLEIANLRRELEKLKYVNIEIVEELKKLNALLELHLSFENNIDLICLLIISGVMISLIILIMIKIG